MMAWPASMAMTCAFDDRTLFGGVDLEAFLQQGFEFFHGCFSAHTVSFLLHVFTGHAVGSAGLGLRLPPDGDAENNKGRS